MPNWGWIVICVFICLYLLGKVVDHYCLGNKGK
jgi:hypothetical protein